jgi:cell division protein FtsL
MSQQAANFLISLALVMLVVSLFSLAVDCRFDSLEEDVQRIETTIEAQP